MLKHGGPLSYAGYLSSPLLSSIPWISGFILAVIPECLIFNVTWYWMFLINIVGIYILGPIITKFFLVRMASGKGLGMDAFIALIIPKTIVNIISVTVIIDRITDSTPIIIFCI